MREGRLQGLLWLHKLSSFHGVNNRYHCGWHSTPSPVPPQPSPIKSYVGLTHHTTVFPNLSEQLTLVRAAPSLALQDLLSSAFSTLSAHYYPCKSVHRPQQAPKPLLNQGSLDAGTERYLAKPNLYLQCFFCLGLY